MWPYTTEECDFLDGSTARFSGLEDFDGSALPTRPSSEEQPKGQLATRSLAMPADTNPSGDMFGGWIMSQMDAAGAITAAAKAGGRVVTAAIDAVSFLKPVKVGDVLCCYTEMERVGRTSISLRVQAWALSQGQGSRSKVAEAGFTFVALDFNGQPRPVDRRTVPDGMPAGVSSLGWLGVFGEILSTWIQYRRFEAALACYRGMSNEELSRSGIKREDIVRLAFARAEAQNGKPRTRSEAPSRASSGRLKPQAAGPAAAWLME